MNNIIFVNRYFYPDLSATSQMLSDLAFALAGYDNQVWVVTSRQTYENSETNLPSLQVHSGVQIRRVWTSRFGRANLFGRALDYLSFYVAAFLILIRITQAGDVIIAKTDPPLVSIIAWIVAKTKRAKLINWLQDVFPEAAAVLGVLTWRPLFGLIQWLRNITLQSADMNVVLGRLMQEHICAQGVPEVRTMIIHNWADGDLIRPVPRELNTLRTAWNLQGKFVVGYSGNMGRAHEFNTIIGAMTSLQDDDNIVFLFIGGGAGKKKLEHAINELRLKNYLFMPYQAREALSNSLSLPDVHLGSLQPRLEGLIVPSKVYGIMAAGRPLIFIGDPEGEIGRLVTKFQFGFAVPVGANERLVERLLELKRKPEMGFVMGAKGRRCFEEKFEFSHAVTTWRSLLARYAVSVSGC